MNVTGIKESKTKGLDSKKPLVKSHWRYLCSSARDKKISHVSYDNFKELTKLTYLFDVNRDGWIGTGGVNVCRGQIPIDC